uniref:Uncharacterized protein n=1 Tax=virus sp. ctqq75 TaxID=2827999 RepID=A0A8S5RF21_9VIRU|nr:MAG TPA: hypothetical protein [virus sp. ctqq75]
MVIDTSIPEVTITTPLVSFILLRVVVTSFLLSNYYLFS